MGKIQKFFTKYDSNRGKRTLIMEYAPPEASTSKQEFKEASVGEL